MTAQPETPKKAPQPEAPTPPPFKMEAMDRKNFEEMLDLKMKAMGEQLNSKTTKLMLLVMSKEDRQEYDKIVKFHKELTTPEGKEKYLAKFGFTKDAGNDYLLVTVEDPEKGTAFFKAKTKRQEASGKNDPESKKKPVAIDKVELAEIAVASTKDPIPEQSFEPLEFKKLPKPIELPKPTEGHAQCTGIDCSKVIIYEFKMDEELKKALLEAVQLAGLAQKAREEAPAPTPPKPPEPPKPAAPAIRR